MSWFRKSVVSWTLMSTFSFATSAPALARSTVAPATIPFARVYLALRGCTSCSHCRTTIRQMARSGGGGAEAHVSTDAVEVRYPKPVEVPLREVIRRLSENRLHDLTLVDVLFEADGSVVTGPSGATFTLRGTEQSFPLRIEPSLVKGENGAPVRLTALVEGWREKGGLTLVARGLVPARAT